MLILALDSSGPCAGVALLGAAGPVLAEAEALDRSASRQVLPLVESVLERAGVRLADLTGLAVASGPGSFTGLRVGIATVNGLARALGLPVVGISSLAGRAWVAAEPGQTLTVMLDAHRGQVHAARFRRGPDRLERECEDQTLAPEQAAARVVAAGDRVVGDGAMRYRDVVARLWPGATLEAGPGHGAGGVGALARDGRGSRQAAAVYHSREANPDAER